MARTATAADFEAALERAATLLAAGEVVAVPTETVYGLAANALDGVAVNRLFAIKQRPRTHPVIVHVASLAMARACAADWPPLAQNLARAFWPGPLTLVVPRAAHIPDVVTAGGMTVAIRLPAHPFLQRLIERCGFPLAAPSANLSGALSPTTAEHVRRNLGGGIPLIVDGGPCAVGIESTVVDVSQAPPRLLRPGIIHLDSLLAIVPSLTIGFGDSEEVVRSPGLLGKHYAPRAKLVVWRWRTVGELVRRLKQLEVRKIHLLLHMPIPEVGGLGTASILPRNPEGYARALYRELHAADDAGAEIIVVEQVPRTRAWHAIRDRLTRASGPD